MATFDSIFPTFLAKCGDLHTLLLSVAFALFIVGVIVTVKQHSSHKSILNLLLRLLLLTSFLVFLPAWVKPFLEPQARSATDRRVEAVYTLEFAAGLPLAGDGPENLTKSLTDRKST